MEKQLIYGQISKVMADVEAIPKNRKNQSQGYSFRGIDDLYFALQAVMAKHGVFTVPKVLSERSEERQTKSGSNLLYRILTIEYTFYASDGSSINAVIIGEGMDSGDKASNKAMSVAQKYALLQVFCIPTEEHKDPEIDSHDVAPVGFDPKNPAHLKSLQMFFVKAGLSEPKLFETFKAKMTGKNSYDMKKVLEDIMGVPE